MNEFSVTNLLALLYGLFFLLSFIFFVLIPGTKERVFFYLRMRNAQLITSIILLIIGVFHLYSHFKWDNFYEGVITIIGIITVVKALIILLYPKILKLVFDYADNMVFTIFLIIVLLLSLYLYYSIYLNTYY